MCKYSIIPIKEETMNTEQIIHEIQKYELAAVFVNGKHYATVDGRYAEKWSREHESVLPEVTKIKEA
jgi:hypothetical protein